MTNYFSSKIKVDLTTLNLPDPLSSYVILLQLDLLDSED